MCATIRNNCTQKVGQTCSPYSERKRALSNNNEEDFDLLDGINHTTHANCWKITQAKRYAMVFSGHIIKK